MINTRILEQRLGWRTGDQSDGTDEPESRPIRHEAVLQGRIRPSPGQTRRSPRRADIEAAWSTLPVVARSIDEMTAAQKRLFALDRTTPAAAALDQLRTQLLRETKANGWRRIGVTSPTRGCGSSFIAAGLAASVARLEYIRVLLLDMDLAAPDLARLLGIAAPGAISEMLTLAAPPKKWLLRIGENLALGLNDSAMDNAADIAQSPDLIHGLSAVIDALAPDLAIHDLPPLLTEGAAAALLPQLDAVLLVSDGTRTQARDIVECEHILEGQVPLLGVILNKSEDSGRRQRRMSRG
ncbi:MAG: exopolysaccharide biosynthesis protein [Pararhodobacter sp.]|nr:exopolysaccharide biosynthesis protein [Pararhodobacter sp.]